MLFLELYPLLRWGFFTCHPPISWLQLSHALLGGKFEERPPVFLGTFTRLAEAARCFVWVRRPTAEASASAPILVPRLCSLEIGESSRLSPTTGQTGVNRVRNLRSVQAN